MNSIRTCLVTGKKDSPENFFRFTIQKGFLIFDEKKKNSGRGGYVSKEKKSLLKLLKLSKKISHFLKNSKCEIQEKIILQKISEL